MKLSPEQRVKSLSSFIRDNEKLRTILMDADPCMRENVYEEINPYLRFNPLPYWMLVSGKDEK